MNDPLVIASILFAGFGKFLMAIMWSSVISVAGLDRRRRIYQMAYGREQWRDELLASWVIPLDGIVLGLAIYYNFIKVAAPELGASLLTFGVLFVWFEIWFYVTHRLMHTRHFYFIHAEHHRSKATRPVTGLRFSLGEKAILTTGSIGFAVAISWVMPVTLPGLLAFLALYYFESINGHSNVEVFPVELVRSPVGKVIGSATFHAMHHARIQGHYGLMTTALDYVFGTVHSDYVRAHGRAIAGQSLTQWEKVNASESNLASAQTVGRSNL